MSAKLIAALLVVAASGCRMCSDSCDYSPPVAGSPYGGANSRAGSAAGGAILAAEPIEPQPLPPAPSEIPPAPAVTPPAPPLTPLTMAR
jgi:hypothetical protein